MPRQENYRHPILYSPLRFALLAATASSALAQTPSIIFVSANSDFNQPTNQTLITEVSADGRSATGYGGSGPFSSFVWTPDGGRVDFGYRIGASIVAMAISADGSTVVGSYDSNTPSVLTSPAFRWSQLNGIQFLPLPSQYSRGQARDVSHDGSVIVGTVDNGGGTASQAFCWTESGGTQLLDHGSTAYAVSQNGEVVIGWLASDSRAFTWTHAQGTQLLTGLNGSEISQATAINHDGSIILGVSGHDNRTTMWTNGVPTELHSTVPNAKFTPYSMSDDASIIVGNFRFQPTDFAAGIWTEATGAIPLADYLSPRGISLPLNTQLYMCSSVSSDGLTFAGQSRGAIYKGFIATILPPCSADLDNDGDFSNGPTPDLAVTIDDLLYFLVGFEAGSTTVDLDNGSNTGTPDNAVTIDDLLYFLTRFEAGC